MNTTCPKCHYQRQAIDAQVHADICPACGIVYQKWLDKQQPTTNATPAENSSGIISMNYPQTWKQRITYVPNTIDSASFWSRVLMLLGFMAWSFYFISAGVDWEKIGGSFLHAVNLPFHEFGHIFFAPFGRFMMILGGSLFQVLMPLGLMLVFIMQQRDNFAASIMLWWCGQNFIDVAPYIDDAQYRLLPLVGGGGEESHDWGNLLTMLNALDKTHTVAHSSFAIGAVIICLALVWSVYILRLQQKNLRP